MNWQTIDPQAAVPNTEQMLTISQVRAQTGLTARTIRYYEEVGLLPGVRRRAGGRRVYGPDEVERLGFITRLKAMGLALGEIKDLNAVYAIGGRPTTCCDISTNYSAATSETSKSGPARSKISRWRFGATGLTLPRGSAEHARSRLSECRARDSRGHATRLGARSGRHRGVAI